MQCYFFKYFYYIWQKILRNSTGLRPFYVVPEFDLQEQTYSREQLTAVPQEICTTCNVSFPVTNYILPVQWEHKNGNDEFEELRS